MTLPRPYDEPRTLRVKPGFRVPSELRKGIERLQRRQSHYDHRRTQPRPRLPRLPPPLLLRTEYRRQVAPRVAPFHQCNLLGRSGCDDGAAACASFRTKIHNPVRGLDDVQVVFDHENRVAAINQAMQHLEQHAYVLEVQSRGGFIQDVQCASRVPPREFRGELYALRLTT